MPDGDIIHDSLPRIYQRPYRWLCEGKKDDADCSKALQQAIKWDLQKAGDPFATAALVVGDAINRACAVTGGLDAARANQAVDTALQEVYGPSMYREAFRDAARDVVQDLRYGRAEPPQDVGALLYARFVCRLADSQFESRVPLAPTHHNGANPIEIETRIRSMAPAVERMAAHLGRQVSAGQLVDELRLPPQKRPSAKSSDDWLSENLL